MIHILYVTIIYGDVSVFLATGMHHTTVRFISH
jgi:hypothetical protein